MFNSKKILPSKQFKSIEKIIPLVLFLFSLLLLLSFTSKFYLPDDRKKMTTGFQYNQPLGQSIFNFKYFGYKDNSIDVLLSQQKKSLNSDEPIKKESFKFYMLVDGQKFSDFEVKAFDDTYDYTYILKAPVPKEFYTLYFVVERIENGKNTNDGAYAVLDYRDMFKNKDKDIVYRFIDLQSQLLLSKENLKKAVVEYDLMIEKQKHIQSEVDTLTNERNGLSQQIESAKDEDKVNIQKRIDDINYDLSEKNKINYTEQIKKMKQSIDLLNKEIVKNEKLLKSKE